MKGKHEYYDHCNCGSTRTSILEVADIVSDADLDCDSSLKTLLITIILSCHFIITNTYIYNYYFIMIYIHNTLTYDNINT